MQINALKKCKGKTGLTTLALAGKKASVPEFRRKLLNITNIKYKHDGRKKKRSEKPRFSSSSVMVV